MNKKLYLVKLRGMQTSAVGVAYGTAYVVAENSEEAYQKVKTYIDSEDVGFQDERELRSIELIAEEAECPACQIKLYL